VLETAISRVAEDRLNEGLDSTDWSYDREYYGLKLEEE
jgi:hypothetical protein